MAPKRNSSTAFNNLISFIPENEAGLINKQDLAKNKRKNDSIATESLGCEARSFYEELIKDEDNLSSDKARSSDHLSLRYNSNPVRSDCEGSTVRKNRKHSKLKSTVKCSSLSNTDDSKNISSGSECFNSRLLDPKHRQHYKLMQFAQLGDEESVRNVLEKDGINVNFTDFYGWTPLMCAAKEGHTCVVNLLLEYGADRSLCSSSGDTALSVARSAGKAVVSVLESYDTRINHDSIDEKKHLLSEAFYCNICKRDFSLEEASKHQTSTVHLFNSGHHSKGPGYFIPDSNRGFQMLLRSGWNAHSGLGPEGKGRIYPVKTVLKQDRTGLGGEDVKRKKAKVTHFGRCDTEAVQFQIKNPRQISVRKAARNASMVKDKRERRWEQNLRYEMN